MSVGVTATTVTLLNTSLPTLSTVNLSSAQTFSATINSPSAMHFPKRMFPPILSFILNLLIV